MTNRSYLPVDRHLMRLRLSRRLETTRQILRSQQRPSATLGQQVSGIDNRQTHVESAPIPPSRRPFHFAQLFFAMLCSRDS